ncbi:uncharacterized protein TRUGW13939_05785 [Talaromyces rugulosus]|uniref:Uncharacterized protein n=1 Tax=Talaromyces rugulosus TaxID=121627 RepID=A0A7H8QYA2_TALRU|nr:uncharacterized protein TRUGW13939_05785 [Talaromyces rugulosus]QKX58658.1 hypothetical protein TRUGW13939_05785 [Talaromyces rugulosus]
MSSLRSQLQQSNVIAQFPLAKYSYAESLADQHGPVNWTHLHSSDLNVLFEKDTSSASGISSIQQKLRLRVIRAHENLEDLDLNSLAREATQQAISKHARNTKPSVAIIIKDPCLAVRYPFGREQLRRFQLKFSSSRDYREVLEILREINCPFSESSGEHPSRSASLRPDSSSSRILTPAATMISTSNDWSQRFAAPTDSHSWNQGLSRSHTTLGTTTDRQPVNASSPSSISSRLYANGRGPDDSHKDLPRERTITPSAEYASNEQERPITSPAYDTQVLNQVLPPKRDLPFSKPGPRPSPLFNRQPANRFTKWPEPAPKPPKNPNDGSGVNCASPRPHTAQSKVTVPATSSPARQLRLELEDRQWNPNKEKQNPSLEAASASSPLLTTSIFPASSPINGRTQQNGTTTGSLPVATSSALDNPPTSHHQPPVEMQNVRAASQGIPISSADLSTFLATPESERSQLVSNWVCQQLEDDGFRALCQDVERVWQRIAFGT